ncbi:hypothetical protein GCM10027284_30710 [Cyclobacterium sediminis]
MVFEIAKVFNDFVYAKDLRGFGNPKGQGNLTFVVFEIAKVFNDFGYEKDLRGFGNPKGQYFSKVNSSGRKRSVFEL